MCLTQVPKCSYCSLIRSVQSAGYKPPYQTLPFSGPAGAQRGRPRELRGGRGGWKISGVRAAGAAAPCPGTAVEGGPRPRSPLSLIAGRCRAATRDPAHGAVGGPDAHLRARLLPSSCGSGRPACGPPCGQSANAGYKPSRSAAGHAPRPGQRLGGTFPLDRQTSRGRIGPVAVRGPQPRGA